jgi:hypothetical protein
MNAVVVREAAPTNRRTRRELGRRVMKNLMDELKETQRRPSKKVPLKPPVPKQLKSPSFFTSLFEHVVGAIEGCIGWLCRSGATPPDYVWVPITALVVMFSGTEEKMIAGKSNQT